MTQVTHQNSGADAARIFEQWHAFTVAKDVEGLVGLYAEDGVFESPLVPVIPEGHASGVLRGRDQIRRFFGEGVMRLSNPQVRWYRTGKYLTDGQTLIWEYPRETPDGDQVDILEVMELRGGFIAAHRVYWGCFGTGMLARNALSKQPKL